MRPQHLQERLHADYDQNFNLIIIDAAENLSSQINGIDRLQFDILIQALQDWKGDKLASL